MYINEIPTLSLYIHVYIMVQLNIILTLYIYLSIHSGLTLNCPCISRWLSIRLQFLGALIVLFSALYSVILRDYVSTGVVGLIMTYSLEVWLVNCLSKGRSQDLLVAAIPTLDVIPITAKRF